MASRKRKASANNTPLNSAKKKARFSEATVIPDAELPILSPTGRPKRTSVGEPQYNLDRRRSTSDEPADISNEQAAVLPKKRGRPPGKPPVNVTPPPAVVAKKRGRPAKTASPQISPDPVVPKRRGRPPTTASAIIEPPAPTIVKKRGRPSKDALTASPAPPMPKRGRPPKQSSARSTLKAAGVSAGKKASGEKPSVKRTSKPKVDPAVNKSLSDAGDDLAHGLDHGVKSDGVEAKVQDGIDQDVQYWLMKAEPESRIEKGHDVKFSIDDLAARTEPEGWDGVRNPAARNHMRAMRLGDLAFFYHSNCAVPGIAGVMRIAAEHEIDESAFNPDHPYYDPKSDREKPKWELVRVEFVKKFESLVTLKELKSFAQPGSALQDMVMLKQSRLSVSPVSAAQWKFILGLAGEEVSLGQPAPQDGYESDVDTEEEEDEAQDEAPHANGLDDVGDIEHIDEPDTKVKFFASNGFLDGPADEPPNGVATDGGQPEKDLDVGANGGDHTEADPLPTLPVQDEANGSLTEPLAS